MLEKRTITKAEFKEIQRLREELQETDVLNAFNDVKRSYF